MPPGAGVSLSDNRITWVRDDTTDTVMYGFSYMQATQSDALAVCQEYGGYLASPTTLDKRM